MKDKKTKKSDELMKQTKSRIIKISTIKEYLLKEKRNVCKTRPDDYGSRCYGIISFLFDNKFINYDTYSHLYGYYKKIYRNSNNWNK